MKAPYLRSNHRRRSIASVRSTISQRRMLQPLIRHRGPENLAWRDALALFEVPSHVGRPYNTIWLMEAAGESHQLHAPRDKDLTGPELIELRRLMQRAERSAESKRLTPAEPCVLPPTLLVAVDPYGARIYRLGTGGRDVGPLDITPYGLHHFAHHLSHKPGDRKAVPRKTADAGFHERIAAALVTSADIVVVGHGVGNGNAADHLVEQLRQCHPDTYARIAGEVRADLAHMTAGQLLEIGQQVLR